MNKDKEIEELKEMTWYFLTRSSLENDIPSLSELESISCMYLLIHWWNIWFKKSQKGEGEKEKMSCILRTMARVLSGVDDMKELLEYYSCTSLSPKELIQKRMRELLEIVSSDNIPEWFKHMIKFSYLIPDYLNISFRKKAEEIHLSIYHMGLQKE